MEEHDTEYSKARKRFQVSSDYDSEDREAALNDKEFYGGDQWDDTMENDRDITGRPCMTLNLLPKFVRQITGEARLNETSIDVLPGDKTSDPSLAEVYKGLIRTIESDNNAETIYEEALKDAAVCGRGGFRLYTEYEHDMSFDQVIKMAPIPEALAIYFDPAAKMYDKSDGEYAFVTEWMTDEAFERRYGEEATTFNDMGYGDEYLWRLDGQKRVAEYWVKEHKEKQIWLVQTEQGMEVVPSDGIWTIEGLEAEGYEVIDKRMADIVTVWMYEMGGSGFLSREGKKEDPDGKYGQEFVSKYIPIIPVMGPEHRVKGQIQNWSVIRWAKTPQQLYNLWTSQAAEKTSLSPKAPYIATPKMVEGFENNWRDANQTTSAYLLYNPDPEALGGRPERNFPEPVQQGELSLRNSAYDDMHHTTGLPPASTGDPGQEISGVAINARQSESDVGTIDWIKNLHRSIEYAGTVIADMIPRVYDTERVVQILGEDDTAEFVTLNQTVINPQTGQPVVVNDIREGRYNIKIDTGPSSKTSREEAAMNMIKLGQAYPMHGYLLLDYIVDNMDFKGNKEAAKRIKMALNLPDPNEPPPPPPEPTPDQIMDMQKNAADLEGKQLTNAQRQMDLSKDVQEAEIRKMVDDATKDAIKTIEQAAGTPPMIPGRM